MPSLIYLRRNPADDKPNPTTSEGHSTSSDLSSLFASIHGTSSTKRELAKRDKNDTSATATPPKKAGLLSLPPEIHLLIADYLIYPDALSLKHTNRYFYYLVDTGIELKVEWLMERRMLHLECPNDKRCDLGSDLRFCRGSVALLMQRRREHMECESRPGLGCLIYGTRTCSHSRKFKTRFKRWMRSRAGERALLVMLLISVIPLAIGWAWLLWRMRTKS